MKPKVTNLEAQYFNNEEYVIDRLVESWVNMSENIEFGNLAYFNNILALVYDNYMVSDHDFKFEHIKKIKGSYVYRLPFNLSYYIDVDDDGVRIYEGDY